MCMLKMYQRAQRKTAESSESGRQKNKATGPSRHEAFSVADRTATVVRAQTGVEMYRRSLTSDQRRSLRDKRGKFGDGETRLEDKYRALPEDQRFGYSTVESSALASLISRSGTKPKPKQKVFSENSTSS